MVGAVTPHSPSNLIMSTKASKKATPVSDVPGKAPVARGQKRKERGGEVQDQLTSIGSELSKMRNGVEGYKMRGRMHIIPSMTYLP
jgi:hypothetical protein